MEARGRWTGATPYVRWPTVQRLPELSPPQHVNPPMVLIEDDGTVVHRLPAMDAERAYEDQRKADTIILALEQLASDMMTDGIIEQATQSVEAHPARECPHCATLDTYLYQGEGHWYCGVCEHDGWDEETPDA